MKVSINKKAVKWIVAATVLIGGFLYFRADLLPPAYPGQEHYANIYDEFFGRDPAAVNSSPDGNFFLTKAELRQGGYEVVVRNTSSGERVAGFVSQSSQRSLNWRPDGKAIVFQQTEGLNRPLYLMNLSNNEVQKLNAPVSQTGLPPLRWSPDGTRLAYFHGDTDRGNIVIIQASGDANLITVRSNVSSTTDFQWSPDGKAIAISTESEPGSVFCVSVADLATTEISVGEQAKIYSVAWSPDGKSILVTARRQDDEYSKLYELKFKTGYDLTSAEVALVASTEGDIQNPVWLPDSKTFVYHILRDGRIRAVLGSRTNPVIQTVGPTNGVLRITHANPKGDLLYARFASLSRPPSLVSIRIDGSVISELYSPPSSSRLQCVDPESLRITSFDGTAIPAYYWKSNETNSPRSLVIEIHGGTHTQTYPTWEAHIKVLTERGIDFLAVNWRGSSGYGRTFEELGEDPERALDIVSARNYAVTTLKYRPDRIYLMGNSHGSKLSAAAAAHGETLGGLVLISWIGAPEQTENRIPSSLKVLAFQGDLDPLCSPGDARKSIRNYFAPASSIVQTYHFKDEGHFFYNVESWARICSGLVALDRTK